MTNTKEQVIMTKISKTKYKRLEKQCLELIIENSIIFIDEIFIYAEVMPSAFFETGLLDSVILKDAIEINRAKLKRDLRTKWFESTNATLNAALYKLVCTEEEKRALSASAVSKTAQGNDVCTQEEYLKSLKEMSEGLDNAD